MKKINLLSFLLSILIIAQTVAAQCSINGEEVPCDQFWDAFGVMFTVFGIAMLVLTVFWVWMLIDCIKRDFKDKALWIIILVFGSFIGSIVYFFAIKRKKVSSQPGLAPKI